MLCSFDFDFSYNCAGFNIKPLSKNAAILICLVFLFITSQASSFPNIVHNIVSRDKKIKIETAPQKIIIDVKNNQKKQELDINIQDLVLQYENLKISKNVKKNKGIIIKFVEDRLVYLRDKSITTNDDIKNYNSRYINATNRKISLEKNIVKIQSRLDNYNSKKENNYQPDLPYVEFKIINSEDVTPNYLIISYSLEQFQNIIQKIDLTADDIDKLDSISLKMKNQFDDIDKKLRPIYKVILFREKLLDNKEAMQRIIETRLEKSNC